MEQFRRSAKISSTNENKLLLPGMFARTRIAIYEKENVISVPNDALEKTQEGHRVYIVKDNKAEVRPVEVSYVSLTHSVIESGLESGDQVIVQRPQELKTGIAVKVIEVEKGFTTGVEGSDLKEMGSEKTGKEQTN